MPERLLCVMIAFEDSTAVRRRALVASCGKAHSGPLHEFKGCEARMLHAEIRVGFRIYAMRP